MFQYNLFSNIRFYILLFSLTLSVLVFILADPKYISYTQIYALLAIGFLYLTLLVSPLTRLFTFLPFRGELIKARRALGVSSFYFALIHATLAFIRDLGGLNGLFNLDSRSLLAVALGLINLTILALMVLTAFDSAIDKLTFPRWKLLHRFIYAVAIFVVVHVLLIGSHFSSPLGLIPRISFVAVSILVFLESIRLNLFLSTNYFFPRYWLILLVILGLLLYGLWLGYVELVLVLFLIIGGIFRYVQVAGKLS